MVQNLVQHGYNVRACVRDSSRLDKVAHLVDMGSKGPGSVTLYDCDMFVDGAYDEAFKGVTCVYHVAAELGSTEGATPQSVYDGGMVATQKVLDSVIKSGAPGTPSVQRFIFTSSFAAVGHPGAPALGVRGARAGRRQTTRGRALQTVDLRVDERVRVQDRVRRGDEREGERF